MKKSIFKVGDKVFDFRYGWGVVDYDEDDAFYPINVEFVEHEDSYTWDGRAYQGAPKVLSFTEYTIEGFSQERPEELPKKGDIVWGRNDYQSKWNISHFFEKRGNDYLLSSHPNPTGWHINVQEITTENPYKDEETSI